MTYLQNQLSMIPRQPKPLVNYLPFKEAVALILENLASIPKQLALCSPVLAELLPRVAANGLHAEAEAAGGKRDPLPGESRANTWWLPAIRFLSFLAFSCSVGMSI